MAHHLSALLIPLRTYLDGFILNSSWVKTSTEDTKTRNEMEFLSVDSELFQVEFGMDRVTPKSKEALDRLSKWALAANSSLESGKQREVDFSQGLELLKALRVNLSEADLAGVGLCSTSLESGAKRSHHVTNSLAEVSEQLHRALVHQSQCCGNHIARIDLDGFKFREANRANHFLLFISNSHRDSTNCRWQETKCDILIENHSFGNPDTGTHLCHLLSECEQFDEQLHFTLQHTAGHRPMLSGKRVNSASRQDWPTISLGVAVDQRENRDRQSGKLFLLAEKAALCLNLSFALIHLAPDSWVNRKWSLASIFLAFDTRNPKCPTLDREQPYLSSCLIGTDSSLSSNDVLSTSCARARFLSFAQVLMEIYLEKRLCRDVCEDDKRFLYLRDLVKNPDIKGEIPRPVIQAIDACIGVYRSETQGNELCKRWIYNEIVLKMEENRQLFCRPERREPRRWGMNPTAASRKRKPDLSAVTETSPVANGPTPKRQKIISGDDWFNMIDCLNLVLSAEDGDHDYEKVRVAVLDTGIGQQAASKFGIQDHQYRDFTDHPDHKMRDDSGHGTSIVDLVVRVCEPAEIYVARAWENEYATATTVESTIKALEWAMSKRVDIICMAFGFTTSYPDLRKALRKASYENILVFAAASNYGNLSGVLYPAIWSDCVFCVFSTNAVGLSSHQINPTGRNYDNFAILGEGVKLYSGETGYGTSWSTAIACGFAARLLDFARQKHDAAQKHGNLSNPLKDKMGMENVFREVSRKHGGYSCMTPWSLLPEHVYWQSEDLSEDDIQTAREKVFYRISHSLSKS